MTPFREIIAAARPTDAGLVAAIPPDWMQGRTAYGGVSTALALHAAQGSDTDLPPLRSAQVAFVGPLAGEVTVTAERLRRGRNAAFIQADVRSEAGLGLRATFVFMGEQASTIDLDEGLGTDHRPPGPDETLYVGPDEFFTGQFEFRDRKEEAPGPAEWLRWARLRDRDGLDPMVELMLIADALPPAALKMVGKPAPVSSVTWLVNLLTGAPVTQDGWWLMRSVSGYAKGGCSSQDMMLWSADGRPVARGMQSVALFV